MVRRDSNRSASGRLPIKASPGSYRFTRSIDAVHPVLSVKASPAPTANAVHRMLSGLLSFPGPLTRNELDVRETPRGLFFSMFVV